jgi:hypothetical protein
MYGAFFSLMLPAAIFFAFALAVALGLALTGHGSDAAHTDWPADDWRTP